MTGIFPAITDDLILGEFALAFAGAALLVAFIAAPTTVFGCIPCLAS